MKQWSELTEKELQTEIAINLTKIANILEMAFQPQIRQYMDMKEKEQQITGTINGLKAKITELEKKDE